jgi:hypothetical protein
MTEKKAQNIIELILIVFTIIMACAIGYFLVSQSAEVANAITLIGEALRGLR